MPSMNFAYQSPYEAFAATAARLPDAPFLIAPASAQLPLRAGRLPDFLRFLKADVERLRAEYAAAGYGHGARVALLLENRPVFFVHWLALNALGVVIVPLNPDMRPDEVTYQLEVLAGRSSCCCA